MNDADSRKRRPINGLAIRDLRPKTGFRTVVKKETLLLLLLHVR